MLHSPKTSQKRLIAAVRSGNVRRGMLLLNSWLDTFGFPVTLRELIHPVLEHFESIETDSGEQGINMTQSFAFGAMLDQVFTPFAESIEKQAGPYGKKGRLLIGNAEGDFHPLGRKMVATMARMHHWEVIDLGNDITVDEFIESAVEHRPTIIGVSAMTSDSAKKIPDLRKALQENHLEEQVRLAVGGAVFTLEPSLAEEVGADGTAANALESIKLFDNLSRKETVVPKSRQSHVPKFATVDYLTADQQNTPQEAPF